MSWLPDDFVHPVHVPVPGTALHLRPIREADAEIDYPAVMGSRRRLWQIFGPALVVAQGHHDDRGGQLVATCAGMRKR